MLLETAAVGRSSCSLPVGFLCAFLAFFLGGFGDCLSLFPFPSGCGAFLSFFLALPLDDDVVRSFPFFLVVEPPPALHAVDAFFAGVAVLLRFFGLTLTSFRSFNTTTPTPAS